MENLLDGYVDWQAEANKLAQAMGIAESDRETLKARLEHMTLFESINDAMVHATLNQGHAENPTQMGN